MNFPYTAKAIPCSYNGVNFRSLLEGRIACFFDRMGYEWEYEPFEINGYIPDFVMKTENAEKRSLQGILKKLGPINAPDGTPCCELGGFEPGSDLFIIDVKPFFDDSYIQSVLDFIKNDSKNIKQAMIVFFSGIEKITYWDFFDLSNSDSVLGSERDTVECLKKVYPPTSYFYGMTKCFRLYESKITKWTTPILFLPSIKGVGNLLEVAYGFWTEPVARGFVCEKDGTTTMERSMHGSLSFFHHGMICLDSFSFVSKIVKDQWDYAQNKFQYKGKKPQLSVIT